MFNRVNVILFLLILFFISISFIPQTIEFDNYEFKVSPKFKVKRESNDENVLLTLSNKDGVGIIMQNKLNILTTTLLKSYKGDDLLISLHKLKHSNYIQELEGYDVSAVSLDMTSNTTFTKQTFKHKYNEVGVFSDLRVVQIDNNYYSLYAMIMSEDKEEYIKVLDDIIFSMKEK